MTITESPDNPDAAQELLAEAIVSHVGGDLSKAEHQYRQVLAHDPDHSVALNNLGLALAAAQQPAAALDVLRRAVTAGPRSIAARVNLAEVLVAEGRVGEAAEQLTEAEALDRDHHEVQERLAALETRAGETVAAERRLWRALHSNDHVVSIRVQLVDLLLADEHFDLASSLLASALEEPAPPASVLVRWGWLHLARANHGTAEAAFRQALSIEPADEAALTGLAMALVSADRGDEARAELTARIEVPTARRELGVLELGLGNGGEAMLALSEADRLAPGDPKTEYYLALAEALHEDGADRLHHICADEDHPYCHRAREAVAVC